MVTQLFQIPLFTDLLSEHFNIIHPELAFFVNKVCHFMHAPQEHHRKVVKRILRYVVGSTTHGLHLHSSSTSSIMGFSDADWATDLDDRRSTIGYCVHLGNKILSHGLLKNKRSSLRALQKLSTEVSLLFLQSCYGFNIF